MTGACRSRESRETTIAKRRILTRSANARNARSASEKSCAERTSDCVSDRLFDDDEPRAVVARDLHERLEVLLVGPGVGHEALAGSSMEQTTREPGNAAAAPRPARAARPTSGIPSRRARFFPGNRLEPPAARGN